MKKIFLLLIFALLFSSMFVMAMEQKPVKKRPGCYKHRALYQMSFRCIMKYAHQWIQPMFWYGLIAVPV